jgi:hypothetical protein
MPENGIHPLRSRWMSVATPLLLLLGCARIFQVVFHSPMLGYANNFDFIKLSSTVGIWLDEPGVDPFVGHAEAPFSHYRSHGKHIEEFRYRSSETLLVYPAIAASDLINRVRGVPRDRFDLRTLGAVKGVFFLAAGAFLTIMFFRRSPWAGLISAFVFAAVICDPSNTLYFNTLYFDDSAVLFTYLAVGIALLMLSTERSPGWLIASFCIALVCAGWSKMQHPGLPLALVLGYGIAKASLGRHGHRSALRMIAPPAAAAVLTLAGGIIHNRSPSVQGMVNAAATDVWFNMTLPSFRNPAAVLDSLGLPSRCGAYVGKSWYDPGMGEGPCPEIFRLTRFRMVQALLKEPGAIGRILAKAVALSRPFLLWYGQVEGQSSGNINAQGIRFFSVGSLIDRLPVSAFATLIILSLTGGFLSLVLLLLGRPVAGAALCVLTNAVLAATFLASLLGDGYADLCRHFHLGLNALLLSALAAAAVFVQLAIRFGRRRTQHPLHPPSSMGPNEMTPGTLLGSNRRP